MLPNIENLIKQVYKCNIHKVPCYEPYMTFIEAGKKTIEGRVGAPYYTKIKTGDVVCLHNRKKEIWCEITRTHLYPTFKDMLEKEGLKKMLPQANSIEEGVQIYRNFPTFADKELKFGAYALEVKFINLEELKKKTNVVTSNTKRPREQDDDTQVYLRFYQEKTQEGYGQSNSTVSDAPVVSSSAETLTNPTKKMKIHPML